MTSLPLRREGIRRSYENSLRVESHPGQQISGEKKIKLIDGSIDFRLVATLILLGSIYHLIKLNEVELVKEIRYLFLIFFRFHGLCLTVECQLFSSFVFFVRTGRKKQENTNICKSEMFCEIYFLRPE